MSNRYTGEDVINMLREIGTLAGGTLVEQFDQALANVVAALAGAGVAVFRDDPRYAAPAPPPPPPFDPYWRPATIFHSA